MLDKSQSLTSQEILSSANSLKYKLNNPIIGYIHVTEKGEWKRSLELIMNSIHSSGLYDRSTEIRVGLLSNITLNDAVPNSHWFLKYSKMKIVARNNDLKLFERLTLLSMRNQAEKDDSSTLYYYLHTKGLKHFNTAKEYNVIDWIQLMLYWNIDQWQLAVYYLQNYSTYGINYISFPFWHYSGNFWWVTNTHVRKLDKIIGDGYTDPEFWIFNKVERQSNDSLCIYHSTWRSIKHYHQRYPQWIYKRPDSKFKNDSLCMYTTTLDAHILTNITQ